MRWSSSYSTVFICRYHCEKDTQTRSTWWVWGWVDNSCLWWRWKNWSWVKETTGTVAIVTGSVIQKQYNNWKLNDILFCRFDREQMRLGKFWTYCSCSVREERWSTWWEKSLTGVSSEEDSSWTLLLSWDNHLVEQPQSKHSTQTRDSSVSNNINLNTCMNTCFDWIRIVTQMWNSTGWLFSSFVWWLSKRFSGTAIVIREQCSRFPSQCPHQWRWS